MISRTLKSDAPKYLHLLQNFGLLLIDKLLFLYALKAGVLNVLACYLLGCLAFFHVAACSWMPRTFINIPLGLYVYADTQLDKQNRFYGRNNNTLKMFIILWIFIYIAG